MSQVAQAERKVGLDAVGIQGASRVHWNLSMAALYEEAVRRGEGVVSADGPLVCSTGQHTGRSPNDKFIVAEPSSERNVAWGKVNRPIDQASFDEVLARMQAYVRGRELFVLDAWAGADPAYRLPIRVITEKAWHNLFARHLFIPELDPVKRADHDPQFTAIDIPSFKGNPATDHTNSETFILLNFAKRIVLLG